MATNNATNLINLASGTTLGMARLDKQTASGSSELEFTLTGSIEQYVFSMDRIIPASAAPFYMLWSKAGGYMANYAYIRQSGQSVGPAGATDYAGNQNQIVISNIENVQVFYDFGIMGYATLQGHDGVSGFARSNFNVNFLGTSSGNTNMIMNQGWAYCAEQPGNAVTKVKFVFDSVNIASGSITLYGQVA